MSYMLELPTNNKFTTLINWNVWVQWKHAHLKYFSYRTSKLLEHRKNMNVFIKIAQNNLIFAMSDEFKFTSYQLNILIQTYSITWHTDTYNVDEENVIEQTETSHNINNLLLDLVDRVPVVELPVNGESLLSGDVRKEMPSQNLVSLCFNFLSLGVDEEGEVFNTLLVGAVVLSNPGLPSWLVLLWTSRRRASG